MKIIPQNGMILVRYLGCGETTTEAGIVVTGKSKAPNSMEVVTSRVLALDCEHRDENDQSINLVTGQIVMTQAHSIRPIADDATNKNRGLIRWPDVLAVVEKDGENVN